MKATAEDCRKWAKQANDTLTEEGYLMAADTIEALELKVARYKKFTQGIKPYLIFEGYEGLAKQVDEI